MPVVALETRDPSVALLAALPSANDYFYPLTETGAAADGAEGTERTGDARKAKGAQGTGGAEQPLRCLFLAPAGEGRGGWGRGGAWIRRRLPYRVREALETLGHLRDCYRCLDGIGAAREVHVRSLLALPIVWWWQRGQHERRTLVLYAQGTELARMAPPPWATLAGLIARRADVVVVENDDLQQYVCETLGARRDRVHTVANLIERGSRAPLDGPDRGMSVSVSLYMYMHPERRALFDLCRGRGIDVGCGSNKTHPRALGVDLTPRGALGRHGNQRWQVSEADVVASGDDLGAFPDGSLDYVVERHNLEHYLDPVKALLEWRRVLRPGGVLGMVVPDDEALDTIPLDPTHKHAFTRESLARLVATIGGLEVVENRVCVPGWSFVLVARKIAG